jgi:predicted Fe-Mo cluster-binding NifX family protein
MPVWQELVSPVFDVARTILVADVDTVSGRIRAVEHHAVDPARPATTLQGLGVDLLICSAISPPVEAALWMVGIEVVPDICGPPEEIIAAFFAGAQELQRYRAPGSRRWRTQPDDRQDQGAASPRSSTADGG